MAPKAVLFAAILLYSSFSVIFGQRIMPSPIINGTAGQSISIICEPSVPGQSDSTILQIFSAQQMFVNFETTADADARLRRNETDGLQLTNYTFGPLTAQDDGTVFRCLSAGTVSRNSTINVQFAPIITPVTQVFEATENMAFMATFTVSANPSQTSYSWEKDGQSLTANARISLSLMSIQFTSVLREDAGMYSLSVTNSVGTTTFRFNLTVRFGPEFDSRRTDVFNCSEPSADGSLSCASYEGVTGSLLCTPVGYPLPTVSVVSAGVSELTNVVISGDEIAITSVQSGNAGNYTCTATSSLGSIVGLIQFFVGGAPIPVNIAIVNRTDGYVIVRLTYDNSQNGVPATIFYVDVVRVDTNEVVASFPYPVTASDLRNISISGFRASEDRMFNVLVRAENLHGNSTALSDVFTIPGGATVLHAPSLLCVLLSLVVFLFY